MTRPGPKQKLYPESEVERVRHRYEKGDSVLEVAGLLGRSRKYVQCLMKRHGIATRIARNFKQYGEANPNWKGDDCGYSALHSRLYTRFGKPTACSVCGTRSAKRFEYANLSQSYLGIYDFAPMCTSCHSKQERRGVRMNARIAAKKEARKVR